eukprot:CAMPEP_0194050418 /NCGR_PEP_ID=MMETSP0009_2-20130614/35186_1 /TAXON_ID=210454 /ORGANISM="Grammatophora oceanica, Strain CCMP 410" /LENGTH=79 /DNA_ID=CAMNT_0038697037 /DNA_START=100 /DNA_END=336 /DNA_ORIENTATION=+
MIVQYALSTFGSVFSNAESGSWSHAAIKSSGVAPALARGPGGSIPPGCCGKPPALGPAMWLLPFIGLYNGGGGGGGTPG